MQVRGGGKGADVGLEWGRCRPGYNILQWLVFHLIRGRQLRGPSGEQGHRDAEGGGGRRWLGGGWDLRWG